MLKLLGLLAVSISVILLLNTNIIMKYFTYIFLTETVHLLEVMKNGCMLGKTYSSVFSKTDYSRYRFYIGKTEYTYKYLLTKQRMDTVDQLFSETGKRNKNVELEFLQINITNLQRMADEYKLFVDTNKKTSFLSAVSLIMIITIVII